MRILVPILVLFGLPVGAAQAQTDAARVDLELVLAVDISYSMDADELQLQRDGYAGAIQSKPVLDAIASGSYGRIAVTYVEWAGSAQQAVLLDWQIIDGAESARDFAGRLLAAPASRAYRTSISGALAFSAALLDSNPYDGTRRVIDISGDGPNNQGAPVTAARDRVVARGIGINGLPLSLKAPNASLIDVTNLEEYYRACVIGGPGAFAISVSDKARFADAIRTKMVLEISAREPPAVIIPAQARPVDCLIGETIWRERYGDGGPEWQ